MKKTKIPKIPQIAKDRSHESESSDFFTVRRLSQRWACHPESIRRDIRNRKMSSVVRYGKHLIHKDEIARIERESMVTRLN